MAQKIFLMRSKINQLIFTLLEINLKYFLTYLFSQNLRTENGADIEGYIKKTAAKSKITGDFLFSKSKEEKKTKKNGKPEANVNKESEALI